MSLYDYFIGDQSWKDHVNNRDLGRRFENALTKAGSGMALQLNARDQHRVVSQGLGSIDRFSEAVSDLKYEIGDVSAGIDHLRADFNVMMGDVVWKLELQGKTLADMLRTLQAPLDTAARELRARAEDAYRNGWYEESLGDFLRSEEKNYQDFSVQRSIGNICLYHLVDLPRATEYFKKAAKYARPRDSRQAAEAVFFAGIACGLQQDHEEGSRHFAEAVSLNPAFSEAHYMHASFAALLGRAAAATASLESAIAGDCRYFQRALGDACFDRVRGSVESTLDGLASNQKALATQRLDYLQKVIRSAGDFEIRSSSVDDAQRGHDQLASLTAKGSYVEHTAAVRRSLELAKAVVEAGQKALDERIQQLRGNIERRKTTLRKEIQEREDRLRLINAEQTGIDSPAVPIALGIVMIVVGIVMVGKGSGFGFIVGTVGCFFVVAGLALKLSSRRLADEVSEVAQLRSNLDYDRDGDILQMTDQIRVAESAKKTLTDLRPTGMIQAAHV